LAGVDRTTVARQRRAAPTQLSSALRGDLDWIVMRCLEKDRTRRYDTAHELADDVRHHLRHEPVTARPPSAFYRLQKFVARNRLACASAAAIAAALAIGTVVSVRQAVRATRAERTANAERDAANAASRAETLARADAQRRQGQAEDLLTFMLGDFRTELQKIGRLQMLDTVGEKAIAYFAALTPRDLTDTALARQARALTQIGQIRMDQARYPEAATAFATAYERAAALAARHPQDADMLFERAQAEYWIGFIARRRGDFAAAREWLTRYRDSAIALVAIEGKTLRAQRELTSSQHNLAVLEFDGGDLGAARNGFLAERSAVAEMLAANPDDLPLQFRMADIASWLGRIAEGDGRYTEAIECYTEMTSRVEKLAALEPTNALWRFKLVESIAYTGSVRVLLGQRSEAAASYARARTLSDALTAQDPGNQQWLATALGLHLLQVTLLIADNDLIAGSALLGETRGKLDALAVAEPLSRVFTGRLADAWRLEAWMRATAHRADAREAAERAVDLGEMLIKESRADDRVVGEFAASCVLAGRIAFAQARPEAAQRHWSHVLEVLAPRLANSNDWRFLDPAAQALLLLGRSDEARPLTERLRRFGYHPIDPAAASALGLSSFPATSTQTQ
jgi:serine/threonine-protein kinase